ncbi:uncharacterized protein [Rutidosis leptorrhynchoides]|uniref:uncharacterized protein n=1 Tax=Rutidosis leptorrhynchoides TaxID=125765 RepID=UPI003A99FE9F
MKVGKQTNGLARAFSLCCLKGKIALPEFNKSPPKLIWDLYTNNYPKSQHFIENVRQYNMIFAFTSMDGKVDDRETNNRKEAISGKNRTKASSSRYSLDEDLIRQIMEVLDEHNPLVKMFRMARDWFLETPNMQMKIKLIGRRTKDGSNYNLPTVDEVAALIVGDINISSYDERNIIIDSRIEGLKRISELHTEYLALQYPLMFIYAEDGYRKEILHRDVDEHSTRMKKRKRSLPHAHICLFLDERNKMPQPEDVDTRPEPYQLMSDLMIHGPCGEKNPSCPCTDSDRKCTKRFPKPFSDVTKTDEDGYLIYRRRDDGRMVTKQGHELDNRSVVAYNPYLLKRILLNKVEGPTSYQDIQTVNGQLFNSYRDACYDLGLLDDDKEYIEGTQIEIELLKDLTLQEIDKLLQRNSSSLRNFITKLTSEQKEAYDQIIKAVDHGKGAVFFLYGYGGTRKTFFWKTLSAALRSEEEIVLNVASSGIAALLLSGGRTAHSRFHIPLHPTDPTDESFCTISPSSKLGELIRRTKLLIWDEAPMVNKICVEALDHSMRDICRQSNPDSMDTLFGGKQLCLVVILDKYYPLFKKVKEKI